MFDPSIEMPESSESSDTSQLLLTWRANSHNSYAKKSRDDSNGRQAKLDHPVSAKRKLLAGNQETGLSTPFRRQLETEFNLIKEHLLACLQRDDWHGVANASASLSAILAKLALLNCSASSTAENQASAGGVDVTQSLRSA